MKRRGFFASVLGAIGLVLTGGKWGNRENAHGIISRQGKATRNIRVYIRYVNKAHYVDYNKAGSIAPIHAYVINKEDREEIKRLLPGIDATVEVHWNIRDDTEVIIVEPHSHGFRSVKES